MVLYFIGLLAWSVVSGITDHDFRYTLTNNTDTDLVIVSLSHSEYENVAGRYISGEWTLKAGQSIMNQYSDCFYVLGDQNQEIRSYKLNQNIKNWIGLKEGEQRVLLIGDAAEECPYRLKDIEYCYLGKGQFASVNECLQ